MLLRSLARRLPLRRALLAPRRAAASGTPRGDGEAPREGESESIDAEAPLESDEAESEEGLSRRAARAKARAESDIAEAVSLADRERAKKEAERVRSQELLEQLGEAEAKAKEASKRTDEFLDNVGQLAKRVQEARDLDEFERRTRESDLDQLLDKIVKKEEEKKTAGDEGKDAEGEEEEPEQTRTERIMQFFRRNAVPLGALAQLSTVGFLYWQIFQNDVNYRTQMAESDKQARINIQMANERSRAQIEEAKERSREKYFVQTLLFAQEGFPSNRRAPYRACTAVTGNDCEKGEDILRFVRHFGRSFYRESRMEHVSEKDRAMLQESIEALEDTEHYFRVLDALLTTCERTVADLGRPARAQIGAYIKMMPALSRARGLYGWGERPYDGTGVSNGTKPWIARARAKDQQELKVVMRGIADDYVYMRCAPQKGGKKALPPAGLYSLRDELVKMNLDRPGNRSTPCENAIRWIKTVSAYGSDVPDFGIDMHLVPPTSDDATARKADPGDAAEPVADEDE